MSDTLSPLIQAALAPVFLLSAIGVTLSVIDTRQNRIVDRVRALEKQVTERPDTTPDWEVEITFYLRRARQIGQAAALGILSAISVAVVVVALLADAQTEVSLSLLVEVAFTAAILFYGLSLLLFLRDVLQVNQGLAFVEARIRRSAGAGPPPD
jgi:hypothetical protein